MVMTDIEPFVVDNDGRPDGFYAEIWDVVAAELGVDYDVVWVETFGELLPTVASGRADLAVAPLSPTAEREENFDFTSAVISSGPQFGYHERLVTRRSLFSAMFSSSIRNILLIALLGLLVLAHLIWLVERSRETDGESQDFDPRYLQGIWDGLWWSMVTVTTVGYGDKAPRSVAGRGIALLAMLMSLFLVGAIVSQVTGALQENRTEATTVTLDNVGERPVGVVAGTSFAAFVESQGVAVVPYRSQTEAFEAAQSGEIDLVVANPFALSDVGSRYGLVQTGEVLYEEFETFGLAQGSPWREPINRVLADLQSSGEVGAITARWID